MLGGSGAMEDSPMPRLYREAPINAIWEGSGNVQCLDVLRAISRAPQTLDAYFAEIDAARGANRALDAHVAALKDDMRDLARFREPSARPLRPARARPAGERHGQERAGGERRRLLRSRLEGRGAHNWGALPKGLDLAAIVRRALPR